MSHNNKLHENNSVFLFIRLILFISIITFSLNINAQSSIGDVKSKCVEALKNNNINNFVSTFSNPVDLSLPNNENSYSKIQAKEVMKKFLQKNKTKTFKVKQSGKATGGSEFVIAEMNTEKGVKYHIYLLITNSNNEAKLHLVEFELID